jgi:HNH endonuclease/Homing endonuclease associated repeat
MKSHPSRRDFDRHAEGCRDSAVLSHFGSWDAALGAIGIPLTEYKADRRQITNAKLLAELARVRSGLWHRPSTIERGASDAAYSYRTCKQRFGGWINACASLVSGNDDIALPTVDSTPRQPLKLPAEKNLTVPLKQRLPVLRRDTFRRVLCGRTPAINPRTVFHIDHIVPFFDNGPTAESNLRTLCKQYRWGKGVEPLYAA